MHYMGGKMRQGPKIAEHVIKLWRGKAYYEPFCGALGTAIRVAPLLAATNVTMYLSDVSQALVTMWQALIYDGWTPPPTVSEKTYRVYWHDRDPLDPMTAYIGFAISFGGKYYGAYARNKRGVTSLEYSKRARRTVLNKVSILTMAEVDIKIACVSYEKIRPRNSTMYLDPPYLGEKVHDYKGTFDHDAFYDYAREMVKRGNLVILTGFNAPKDFVRVFNWGDTIVRHHDSLGSDGTVESIFLHKSEL